MSADTSPMVVSIKPEPTPEEMAAITAAISALTSLRTQETATSSEESGISRWSRQGRAEAMRGLDRGE